MGLLLPFVLVDAGVGWLVWRAWRRRELMGLRAADARERPAYWFSLARLAGIWVLALVGTVAAWSALD